MLQLPWAVSVAGNCVEHRDGRHNNVVDENVFTQSWQSWQSWWCLHNDGRHNNVVDGNLFARKPSTSLDKGCLARRHARRDLDQRHPHQVGECHKNLRSHIFSIDALHTLFYGWRSANLHCRLKKYQQPDSSLEWIFTLYLHLLLPHLLLHILVNLFSLSSSPPPPPPSHLLLPFPALACRRLTLFRPLERRKPVWRSESRKILRSRICLWLVLSTKQ